MFSKKSHGKGKEEDPELAGVISLLFVIRIHNGKGRREDPELAGVISNLSIGNHNRKGRREDPELAGLSSCHFTSELILEKGRGRIRSSRECFSYCFNET